MSIQSGLGNIGAGAGNVGQSGLAWATGRIESIMGSVKTGLGNIWGGGFAGISIERIKSDLIPALEKYCKTIESSINQFNAEADVTSSFAGPEVTVAVEDFVGAVKEILAAYVSTMRAEIAMAEKAYIDYQIGAQRVGTNVKSTATDIRAAASSIRLD